MGEHKLNEGAQAPQEKPKPLTREELQERFGELYQQYQRATDYIQKLQAELEKRDFDYTSFFLSMLFKVMEHPEMYKTEFVEWASANIENALTSFSQAINPEKEPEAPEDGGK